ncbi:hypothetical protein ACI2K6_13000 [Microbacterium sp. NPDC006705]|uniref:hypothetical protein n=1 Tax=Microbacterium sp. NPDC006705 TaxID=3364181 RepID=UPI00385114F9
MISALARRARTSALFLAASGRLGVGWWLLVLVGVYLVLQIVFVVASFGSALVPNGPVTSALHTGLASNLWSTVDYPADGVGHASERYPFAGISDAFTQCIALTMNVPHPDGGLLDAAFAGRHLGTCSEAAPALEQLFAGATDVPERTYNRYWNGYSILTRPLLVLGGVGAVRVVVAALFAAALVFAAVMLGRRVSRLAPLALVPVLLSTNLLTQTLDAFPHVLAFAVLLAGVGVGAWVGRASLPFIFLTGAAVAGVFNFVDYLLNPPVAWSLFVFAVVAARWAGGRVGIRGLWSAGGTAALAWIVGYGATWVTRWAIAIAIFGDSAWKEILSVIGTRMQGQSDGLVLAGPLEASKRNVGFWLTTIPTAPAVAVVSALAVVVVLVVLAVQRRWQAIGVFAALAAPSMLVPLWFELLNNHSQVHLFFVYRAVPAAVGIALAAALVVVARPRRRRDTTAPAAANEGIAL